MHSHAEGKGWRCCSGVGVEGLGGARASDRERVTEAERTKKDCDRHTCAGDLEGSSGGGGPRQCEVLLLGCGGLWVGEVLLLPSGNVTWTGERRGRKEKRQQQHTGGLFLRSRLPAHSCGQTTSTDDDGDGLYHSSSSFGRKVWGVTSAPRSSLSWIKHSKGM